MTEVDFYVLPSEDVGERTRFACRLTEKAFGLGHSVYLHAGDEAGAGAINELLWSFRPGSFLPHGLSGDAEAERIAVGWGEDPGHHCDLMINLDLAVPEFVGRFQRVAEIVVQSPEIRDPLRQSWKRYKHYGYRIKNNKL